MAGDSTPLLSHGIFAARGPFLWRAGALLTATGILTGAFGAHGLRSRPGIKPEQVRSWETGAHYAIMNGLGLMIVSLHPRFSQHRFAGPAILAGSVAFSGSIFALVMGGKERFRFLGPVTPLGGLAMIAGYISLAL